MKRGNLLLLTTAIIWSLGFVSQQTAMESMGPLSFTAIRCTLGGVSMIPLLFFMDRKKAKEDSSFDSMADSKATLKPALLCTAMLFTCIIAQQYGLMYTSVGKGAFITAFYIFLTPLFGLFIGKRSTGKIWISVLLALMGLYMITMTQGIDSVNFGDMLMLIAAASYSIFILLVDGYVHRISPIKLASFQFIMVGILAFGLSLFFESSAYTWENIWGSSAEILYTGIFSCAGGYTLQMLGQKTADPGTASLILSSETIFSLLAGWALLGEVLTGMEYIGCGIMAVAILLAVLPGKGAEN